VDPDELERRQVPARARRSLTVQRELVRLERRKARCGMRRPEKREQKWKTESTEHAGKTA
jgi:hypothetical protein